MKIKARFQHDRALNFCKLFPYKHDIKASSQKCLHREYAACQDFNQSVHLQRLIRAFAVCVSNDLRIPISKKYHRLNPTEMCDLTGIWLKHTCISEHLHYIPVELHFLLVSHHQIQQCPPGALCIVECQQQLMKTRPKQYHLGSSCMKLQRKSVATLCLNTTVRAFKKSKVP